jgi:outer membrane protein OmpA-like peptidoglycan-associated protein
MVSIYTGLQFRILFPFIFFLFIPQFDFSQSALIKTIYFKPNSSVIEKKYEKTLDLLAEKLSTDSFGFLKVFGYADPAGDSKENDILSEKRTTAVYNYLASHARFDATKVYVTWLGASKDSYDLHFPQAHVQQRCVDIWITFSPAKKSGKKK